MTDLSLVYYLPFFPTATIEITRDWDIYLDPQIPSLNTTVIDYMLKLYTGNTPKARIQVLIQQVLAGLLTNGLARIGSEYQFQGTPRLKAGPNNSTEFDGTFWLSGKGDFFTVDPEESKDWLKLRVDSVIEGYAYNTKDAGPMAAIAFLLAYCLVALIYTLYTGISGKQRTAQLSVQLLDALTPSQATALQPGIRSQKSSHSR